MQFGNYKFNPQSSCPPAFSSIGKPTIETSKGGKRCRNTQHNDTQHNDTQHDNKIMHQPDYTTCLCWP